MSIKADSWIKETSLQKNLITPFFDQLIREEDGRKVISYGLSSFGYDIRCTNEFISTFGEWYTLLDPKLAPKSPTTQVMEPSTTFTLPPHGFALTCSIERFKIPHNVIAICLGKSTYARCGIIINMTPLEPEWEGQLTIEISNTTNHPVVIYPNEGIAQILFFESDEDCLVSYKDRAGKYQNQSGIVLSK